MSLLALALSALTALQPSASDSLTAARDSLPTDTMREVTVRAGRVLKVDSFPLSGGYGALKQQLPPPSFGDIVEKIVPGFNDKATHPFAIKQRKRERRHKRSMRALDDYGRLKTFSELLREAYERQMLEDSQKSAR